ncbi:MAG: VWA domain-containing protein [Succinivibrio sp.]|nr:VWA domain-containing protein [Succinivibrio sp.]
MTTPGCVLKARASDTQGSRVAAFSRFYVYAREQGQLQVGPDTQGSISGYLDEQCTVPWRMQTALMFTNPAGRQRSLIFSEEEQLSKLIFEQEGIKAAEALYETLKTQGSAEGVVAQEPDKYVDYKDNFYLLPVLESKESMFDDGNYVRELKVASVVKQSAKAQEPKDSEAVAIRAFKAGLVFVIDSSISMQPYIDRTKQAISQILKRIEKEQLQQSVQFGLISFRSNTEAVPGLEYVSKLFVNPGQATSAQEFAQKLSSLNQATVSSALFDEDAYSGIATAINEVDWQKFGGRYVVLITDAGAIEGQNQLSTTKLDARELRLEAAHRGIALYTLHLLTPSGKRNNNHEKAQSQYQDLTYNEVLHKPLYYAVDAGDVDSYGEMIDELATAITTQVKQASEGKLAAGSALSRQEESKPKAQLSQDAQLLGHAMQLAYLGKVQGTKVPDTLQGWIADRDLVNHRLPTATPVVLLTKLQLSDLKDLTRHILDAANQGLLNPEDMFSQLRSLAVSMGRDPNQLSDNQVLKLGELGLLGEYLEGLPYKSRLQSLDEETWSSMGPDEQNQTIEDLERKLQYYQLCHDDTDRWVSLNDKADPAESVYPIPLEELP